MALNPGAKFEITRFDGTGNFGLWQKRVKDLLAQQGLQKALRDVKSRDMEDVDWAEMQEKAAGLSRLCVSDEVMYHILDLSTPKAVWDKLEGQYMSKTLMNKLFAKQRLYSLKMQEGADLQQHVNLFNTYLTDLARLGVKIDDEDKAVILLCSLPGSYDHLVTTLTYGKDSISLDVITSTLLAHSQRKQSAEATTPGEGLFVKGSKGGGGKTKGKGDGKKGKSKSQRMETVECYYCKKLGHYQNGCPEKKKKEQKDRQEPKTKSGESSSANVAQTYVDSDGDLLCALSSKYTDDWIVDSGCSFHMSPHREWFTTITPVGDQNWPDDVDG